MAAGRRAVVAGGEIEGLPCRRTVLQRFVHVRVQDETGSGAVEAPAVGDDRDVRVGCFVEDLLERGAGVVVSKPVCLVNAERHGVCALRV